MVLTSTLDGSLLMKRCVASVTLPTNKKRDVWISLGYRKRWEADCDWLTHIDSLACLIGQAEHDDSAVNLQCAVVSGILADEWVFSLRDNFR